MIRLRPWPTAVVLALGWIVQALVVRLWLTDSWLITIGFGALGALIGLAAVLAAGRWTGGGALADWLRAARRDELLPAAGPGLRFDLFTPATDRLLAKAEAVARAGHHRVVDLEHLVLAHIELEGEPRPALSELARHSLETRPEVRVIEPPPRLGLAHAAIAAIEAAYGEAVLAGADRIAPVHVLRGISVQLANSIQDGPPPPLREGLLKELREILDGSTPGR